MHQPNLQNRTIAIMPNLQYLRSLPNECIDLIATDPPFAANETFTSKPKPPITPAELQEEKNLAKKHHAPHNEGIGETRVKDVWTWNDDIHTNWKMEIKYHHPKIHSVIEAVEACATENEAAYIAYMAPILLQCWRVLKPTGSLYLHCDDHANSYLRMLINAIFNAENFRNAITWQRYAIHSLSGGFDRVTDTILTYSKSHQFTTNQVFSHLTDNELIQKFPHIEEKTKRRYQHVALEQSANKSSAGEYRTIQGKQICSQIGWRWTPQTFDNRLTQNPNLIYWTQTGRPRYKIYADEYQGNPLGNIWTDIPYLASGNKERTGYATQKPLALYERIIKASTNPNDLVLDIFAGCATTAIAAERQGRQWIACDMAYRSWTMIKRRFYLEGIKIKGMTNATIQAMEPNNTKEKTNLELIFAESQVIGPQDITNHPDAANPSSNIKPKPQTQQTSTWSGVFTKEQSKKMLIEKFGPRCWGCGFQAPTPANGKPDTTLLEVDHIRAKKAQSGIPGDDELYNLALLHPTCNRIKSNRMTLEELRQHNKANGLLFVKNENELVDIHQALKYAYEKLMTHHSPKTP